MSKQFAKPKNYNKPNTGLELQIIHPLLLNLQSQENSPQIKEKPEELKQIQHSADFREQSKSTLVEEDSNQTAENKTSPLWSMNFDRSCTRSNASVGVWIRNIENNHTEGHSYRLDF